MGTLRTFKFQRAVPAPSSNALPPFNPFYFKAVRQLDTTFVPITSMAGNQIWGTVILPANTWAFNKSLMMKFSLGLTIPPGGLPPNYNVQQNITLTGGPLVTLPSAAPFVPVAGFYSTEFVWRMWNDGTMLWVWNEGETNAFWSMNHNNSVAHVHTYAPLSTPIVLTSQITISLGVVLPPAIVGAILQPLFLQAFIEQGTNLGRATY